MQHLLFSDISFNDARDGLGVMTKIFLIEDDETMLALLRTLLSIEGFDVVQLPKGDTAAGIIDEVRREMPALILLDVHIRQINGFDLLYMIRNDDALKHLRVLMSSGMDFKERCREQGADGFILKPYMPEDLIQQIRQLTTI